jgi:Trypsin-co-occurring domain 1
MARLVAFPLEGGGQVLVEVEEVAGGPVRAAVRPGEMAETAKRTFDEAVGGIRAIAEKVMAQVRDLGPNTVEVEFSVKFSGEAGVILAKTAAEGACTIKLSWNPKAVG